MALNVQVEVQLEVQLKLELQFNSTLYIPPLNEVVTKIVKEIMRV